MTHEHFFYGRPIARQQQEEYIKSIVKKYQQEPYSDELRQKVYEELMQEKHLGNISIPFKVLAKQDPSNHYPPHIEVVLDTRV